MKAVYGYTFLTGASTLLNVKEQKGSKRRYVLTAPVRFCVDFDGLQLNSDVVYENRMGFAEGNRVYAAIRKDLVVGL